MAATPPPVPKRPLPQPVLAGAGPAGPPPAPAAGSKPGVPGAASTATATAVASTVAPNQESPTIDEPNGAAAVQLTIWQHPFVANILPFLIALAAHLGIIIFGIATYKIVEVVKEKVKNQVIIPDSVLAPEGQEGGIPHPGLGGDPTRDAAQDKFPDVPANADGISDKPSKDLSQSLGGGAGDAMSSDSISIGPNGGLMGKGHTSGSGSGDGSGSGEGNGGALAPFGVPGGGGGIGPRSNFIGVGGNARKVVFICDATGSMMQEFDNLRVELRKAIDGLRPPQSFNVVFFQENAPPPPDKSLLFASPDNKRKVYDYVDKYAPRGPTDPVPAIKVAFGMHPELIYFLCDPSDFPDPKGTIALFKSLNVGGTVHVNTIAFLEHDEEGEKTLKQIASDSGGIFKYVSEADMNKP